MNTAKLNRLMSLSTEDLLSMNQALCDDPANLNPNKASCWIYKPSARKKMDDIAWVIYHKQQESKKVNP